MNLKQNNEPKPTSAFTLENQEDVRATTVSLETADEDVQLESDRLRYVRRSALFPVKGRMGSAPMSIMIGRFMLVLQVLLGLVLPWMDYRNLKSVASLQQFRTPGSAWRAGFFTSLFFTAILAMICFFEYKGITAKSLIKKRVVEKKLALVASFVLDLVVLVIWIFS